MDSLLDALASNLVNLGAVTINRLNNRWGDRKSRNWVKIITFVLSEYAYYNNAEGSFWESLFVRLGISDTPVTKKSFLQYSLGWWNIVHRYNEIDLAQTLYSNPK